MGNRQSNRTNSPNSGKSSSDQLTAYPAPVGHFFVVDADLTRIVADAVLVPTSKAMRFSTGLWQPLLRGDFPSRLPDLRRRLKRVLRDTYQEKGAPEVWFGDAAQGGTSPEPYVEVAAEFVKQAAKRFRSRETPARLALNVIGSGHGGMRGHKGALIEALVARLTDLAKEECVDIVLVTWGRNQYAAAQLARRRLKSRGRTRGETDPTEFSTLATHARRGKLVLFVGAGVSAGAGLPSWQQLLDSLAEAAPRPIAGRERLNSLDVRDQAEIIRAAYRTPGDFRRNLEQTLSSQRYSLAHALLASIDPREVVTTNYDRLMEDAFGPTRRPAVLPYESVGPSGRWILKIHGSIDRLETIVLTRSDYLGLPERSQALFGIVQAMLMTKHMLFVGYSLNDDTFHRIMHEVRRARGTRRADAPKAELVGTVVTLFDDPLLRALWGRELEIRAVSPLPPDGTAAMTMIPAASRKVDILLDEVAMNAADVTSFLLDDTYDSMLGSEGSPERRSKQHLRELLSALSESPEIGPQIRQLLDGVVAPDPKE